LSITQKIPDTDFKCLSRFYKFESKGRYLGYVVTHQKANFVRRYRHCTFLKETKHDNAHMQLRMSIKYNQSWPFYSSKVLKQIIASWL